MDHIANVIGRTNRTTSIISSFILSSADGAQYLRLLELLR